MIGATRRWGPLIAALVLATPAHADEPVDVCIDASARGQALRDEGRLLEARRAFLSCAEATCPGLIRKDCTAWHAEVDGLVPSIVARAQDDAGHDLKDATFAVDGELVTIDGSPHEIDPGPHTLTWTHEGHTIQESIVARAGEKSRLVDVTFDIVAPPIEQPHAPPPAPPRQAQPPPGFEVPIASWVLGGIGVVGGVVFAGFAGDAVRRRDELRDTCAPRCAQDDVDAIERELIVANVAGGVGIAAVTAAVVIAIVHNVGDDTSAHYAPTIHVGADAALISWHARF